MLKLIYTLLTHPLGLPIEPLWEYVILLAVGEIVHEIAWNASSGGPGGSIVYWITKLGAFLVIWAVLYIGITVVKFVITYWIWFTIGAGILVAGAIVWAIWNSKQKHAT